MDDAEHEVKTMFPYFDSKENPALHDQVDAAIEGAKLLLKSVPGPYVQVNLSGHANETGYTEKPGYGPDHVSVQVNQFYEVPDYQEKESK